MPNKKTIIIAAVILIAVVLAGYWLSRRFGRTSETGAPQTQEDKQAASEALAPPPLPKEIFSYQGEVTAKVDGQLTVLATPAFNSLAKDTVLKIKVNDGTRVTRLALPKTVPKGSLPSRYIKREDMAFSGIEIGDTVTVGGQGDIKNKTEFTAGRIEVIETK